MKNATLAALLILLVLAADFLSKYWVFHNIPVMDQYSLWYPYGGIGIIKNFLGTEVSIIHAINHGAAWNLFSNYQTYLMAFRGILVAGLLLYLFFYNTHQNWVIPLSLIVAGALGNILDYFLYGHVIDMIQISFYGHPYPIFNIADSAITIGIIWMLIVTLPDTTTKKA